MSQSAYPNELAKMLLDHCPVPGLVNRIWPKLQTFITRAVSDTYPLAPEGIFDPERVRAAVEGGLGTAVGSVRFVSMSDDGPFADLETGDMITYVLRSLGANRTEAFNAIALHPEGRRFREAFFTELGNPIISAFFSEHQAAFAAPGDMETYKIILAGPTFILLFFLGYLFAGNEEGVDAMLPLVELLPYAVPFAEPFAELGTWIVFVK